MMQKRPMLVQIESMQQDDTGANNRIALISQGEVWSDDDGLWLHYQETMPDSSATSDVTLQMKANRVIMNREGEIISRLEFQPHMRFQGQYHMPFGVLWMGVYATQVACTQTADDVNIHLAYELDINGKHVSSNELRIRASATHE